MHRLSNGTQINALETPDPPVGAPGYWTNGVPGVTRASALDAFWFNAVQEEIAHVIEHAGQALDKGNNNQLLAAILAMVSGASSGVPVGGIIDYSGSVSDIPSNWRICDGTAGTPDLRGVFVLGASGDYPAGTRGGSATLSGVTAAAGAHAHGGGTEGHALAVEELPPHTHPAWTDTQGDHAHVYHTGTGEATNVSGFPANAQNPGPFQSIATDVAGAHAHNVGVGATGSGWGHAHGIPADGAHIHAVTVNNGLPPYYALAKIMRIA